MFLGMFSGCQIYKEQDRSISYVVRERDTNRDGNIDIRRYNAIGAADADFELIDTDFDGRFDRKTTYGYAIFSTAIDSPVSE